MLQLLKGVEAESVAPTYQSHINKKCAQNAQNKKVCADARNNYMRRPERIAAVSFTSFPTHVVKREREPRKQIKARRIISKENIARK